MDWYSIAFGENRSASPNNFCFEYSPILEENLQKLIQNATQMKFEDDPFRIEKKYDEIEKAIIENKGRIITPKSTFIFENRTHLKWTCCCGSILETKLDEIIKNDYFCGNCKIQSNIKLGKSLIDRILTVTRIDISRTEIKLDKINFELPFCIKFNCSNQNLKKIPRFPNLKILICDNNKNLSQISDGPYIKLSCSNCKLTVLPKLTNCKKLYCKNNVITTLPPLNKCEILKCSSNYLEKVCLKNCLVLSCSFNNIIYIECPKLQKLKCSNNKIKSLSNLFFIEVLICNNNVIENINNIPFCKNLICHNNLMKNVPNSKSFEYINISNNKIKFIPRSYFENRYYLVIENNPLLLRPPIFLNLHNNKNYEDIDYYTVNFWSFLINPDNNLGRVLETYGFDTNRVLICKEDLKIKERLGTLSAKIFISNTFVSNIYISVDSFEIEDLIPHELSHYSPEKIYYVSYCGGVIPHHKTIFFIDFVRTRSIMCIIDI